MVPIITLLLITVTATPSSMIPAPSLTPKHSFVVNLDCDSTVSNTTCENSKAAWNRVAYKIAKSFTFYAPIVVKVDLRPLDKKCDINPRTGQIWCFDPILSSYPTYVTARKDGGPLLRHPQAAIKQKLENVQFSDYDMKIEFNSRAQWWFPNSKKDISKSQIDFSVFAANAIGKGLGFMTGLQSIPINRTILSSRNSFSFFRPQLGSVTDLSHDFNRKPVLTAFDSLIYVNGMSMTRNMDNLNAIPHNNLTDLISVVEGNKSFIKDSITFFRHTMTRIPIIKFEELPLPLEILWRNTSFCDVQIKMDSKKYAMEFALGNHQKLTGTTLKKEMDKAKMKTIFGPLSLKVFDLLGYTINTTLPLPTYVTPDGFSVDDGFAAATELDAYFDGNEETNFPGISTEPDQPAAGDLEIGTLSIPTVTNIPFARDPEILNGELGDTETTAIDDELLNCDDIHDYLDVLLDPCEQNQTRNDSENSRETKRQRTAKGPVLVIQVPYI